MQQAIIFVCVALIALGIRLYAGSLDYARIQKYIESKGGMSLSTKWSPFGPGWFGDKQERIYKVAYLDEEGNRHEGYCKTSMWSGVYFAEDQIVQYAEEPATQSHDHASAADLAAENEKLRQQLADARQQLVGC